MVVATFGLVVELPAAVAVLVVVVAGDVAVAEGIVDVVEVLSFEY